MIIKKIIPIALCTFMLSGCAHREPEQLVIGNENETDSIEASSMGNFYG